MHQGPVLGPTPPPNDTSGDCNRLMMRREVNYRDRADILASVDPPWVIKNLMRTMTNYIFVICINYFCVGLTIFFFYDDISKLILLGKIRLDA